MSGTLELSMHMNAHDFFPRSFQANVDRLFQRIILPGLNELPVHENLHFGETSSIEEFLNRTETQTENYTANEAAKAFTLVLAGLFERQLRIWLRMRRTGALRDKVGVMVFQTLVVDCAQEGGVDLTDRFLSHTLTEMFLVANVFRHGDGRSLANLLSHSSALWNYSRSRYIDILPSNSDVSERLLLQPADVVRYADACFRFWGGADKLPGAVTDSPYN